ncbi:MAG: TM2 domain-containing protein [Sphingobacteriaceae bacterium]|nr:TM2 domain-containing protein [Sphingobacteriaceae bacterium]
MTKKFLSLSAIAATIFLAVEVSQAAFPVNTKATEPSAATVSARQLKEAQSVASTTVQPTKISKSEVKAEKKSLLDRLRRAGGKSQVIALILAALVGGLGIHRFYLGYTWQGVVQLLTLGGCGIWALIDLIRIITGDLQPKDGSYDKTL